MPNTLPITELKNAVAISKRCHETDEPIFITKNGYGDMVIMSTDAYERIRYVNSIVHKVEEAEQDIAHGRYSEGTDWLKDLQNEYSL